MIKDSHGSLVQPITSGNRVITPRDLVRHFGATEAWWERQRTRMVKAGLLVKAGRKFVGDLSKIQAALANPDLWSGADGNGGE